MESCVNQFLIKKADLFFEANNPDLHFLFTRLKILKELNTKISAILNKELKESCQVANVINERLILIATNASVATQLRFQIPDLLKRFKKDPLLKKIRDIQCKVRPAETRQSANSPIQKMAFLSEETATIMLDIANTIADPALKAILMRIAKHTV